MCEILTPFNSIELSSVNRNNVNLNQKSVSLLEDVLTPGQRELFANSKKLIGFGISRTIRPSINRAYSWFRGK